MRLLRTIAGTVRRQLAQVAGTGRQPQVPDAALWTRGVSGRIAPMRHAGLVAVLVVAGCLFASPPAASSDWELQRQCRTMDDCPGPAGVFVPFSTHKTREDCIATGSALVRERRWRMWCYNARWNLTRSPRDPFYIHLAMNEPDPVKRAQRLRALEVKTLSSHETLAECLDALGGYTLVRGSLMFDCRPSLPFIREEVGHPERHP